MLRSACVNIPYLSLQLLLRQNPDWSAYPVAVVSEEKPNGIVTEINREAARAGIRRGMRYAAALSLAGELRASAVSEPERSRCIDTIERTLIDYTPDVEPCPFDSESFWLNAAGLATIHRSLSQWSERLKSRLQELQFYSRVAVGFTRFGSYAAAKSRGNEGPVIFESFEEEVAACAAVPVAVLPIPYEARAILDDLGIETVKQLFDLPRRGVMERFGEAFEALYDFLDAGARLPLQPKEIGEAISVHRHFQTPLVHRGALTHELVSLTADLAQQVREEGQQIREIVAVLRIEAHEQVSERLRPARPTTDSRLLHRLLEMRLENMEIPGAVVYIELLADRVPATREQLALFHQHGPRNLAAGGRAFAQLRAQLGNEAVQRAVLQDEHTPERQFLWQSIDAPATPRAGRPEVSGSGKAPPHHLDADSPADAPRYPLVRRIYHRPLPLPAADAEEMFSSFPAEGDFTTCGPFRYSGWWWDQGPTEHSYYFVQAKSGQIRWLRYDEAERQWMVSGIVD